MKIMVIFTGGTIGSTVKEGYIGTDDATRFRLLSNYKEKTNDTETEFSAVSPYTVLSENLTANELTLLGKTVEEALGQDDLDGIIITHGTDTLSYTAAALGFQFSDTPIPILLVSSAYPLEDKRANGTANFIAAVEAVRKKLRGVFVSYRNAGEDTVCLHTATRLVVYKEADADVYSINGEPYAVFDGKTIKVNPQYRKGAEKTGVGAVPFCEDAEVLMIESHPADCFSYSLERYKAVILCPYHSGTLNTENPHLKVFCEQAKKRQIPVFVVNVKDGVSYESTKAFDSLALTVLPCCTKSSIFIKCWIANSRKTDVLSFVKTPLAQEFCEE